MSEIMHLIVGIVFGGALGLIVGYTRGVSAAILAQREGERLARQQTSGSSGDD